MSDAANWTLPIQLVTTVIVISTFIAYLIQVRIMQGQIAAMIGTNKTQNTLALIQFMMQSEVHEARVMMRTMDETDFSSWTNEQRRHIERVCSIYDVVGILVRAGLVDERIIIDNWGSSIRRTFLTAEPLINEARRDRGAAYWDDLEWLANQSGLQTPSAMLAPTALFADRGQDSPAASSASAQRGRDQC